jgi:hypothetical protein
MNLLGFYRFAIGLKALIAALIVILVAILFRPRR